MNQPINKKKRVLGDHKKIGQRLIPPVVQALPNMAELSYRKIVLPEVLWIAVLIKHLGEIEGTHAALRIAQAAASLQPTPMMGLCSSYATLTPEDKTKIVAELGDLDSLSLVLSTLVAPYPECPLAFLCLPEHIDDPYVQDGVGVVRQLLIELYDRSSRTAVMAMAGAVYLGFCTGKIKVVKDLALAKFPEIEYYPDTDLSKQIAASVRAAINILVDEQASWPRYFWRHGMSIGDCSFEVES